MSITTDKPSKQYVPDMRPQYPVGGVPSTPLESRVGPHPKKDFLTFKSPPSRQLSREKRQEYQLDVSERFYDDYIGGRTTGFQVGHEVGQGVHKVGFDPNLYRANAYQGLAYDPSRPVPRGLDFNHMARVETVREKERLKTQMRQRRMSDSAKPHVEYSGQYGQPQVTGYDPFSFPTLPPVSQGPQFYQQRPQSAMQKNLEQSLRPELVPEVEKWLTSASKEEQQTAEKFLRTISSQGRRPDPASIASKHTSRVRSAVMTPSRQQRQDREATEQYRQLEKYSKGLPQPLQVAPKKKTQGGGSGGGGGYRKLRRSNSDVSPVHGSMFTGTRQQKGHFTVHPEWASEGPGTH